MTIPNRFRGPASPAILVGLALACGACGSHAPAGPPQGGEIAVRTTAAIDTTIARDVVGSGMLASKEETPLAFTIGGVVGTPVAEEGARVGAGARLAVLESSEIDAGVAKAEAASARAERDLARARALYADSVISRQLYDDAATGRDVAASDLKIARFHRHHAEILAPVAGVVLRRLAEPGQTVAAGTPIVLFGAEAKGLVVHLGVPDRDVVRLSPGDPARLSFDTHPGAVFRAHVARLGAAAAPGAGTFDVELHLDAPLPAEFGPTSGLVADVRITPSRRERVRLIPLAALLEGDGERGAVWTLDAGGAAHRREVRIAFVDGDRVGITGELEDAARVVTDGAPFLTAASRPRVVVDRSAR